MPSLSHQDMQASFAAAVRGGGTATLPFLADGSGRTAASRLNVHRNNLVLGLLNVIAARFPVVRRLAGEESFFRVARLFLDAHPPQSPLLLNYGEGFPDFVRQAGSAASFIADIAELELARARSYHAADAVPISPDAFAAIPGDRLGDLHLALHPSVQLLTSRFPIVSVWQAYRDEAPDEPGYSLAAEAALVSRPVLDVEVHVLPPGGFAFLRQLMADATVAEALAAGVDDAPTFDPSANLSVLIGANIVIAIDL
jgi:hypothetical protein